MLPPGLSAIPSLRFPAQRFKLHDYIKVKNSLCEQLQHIDVFSTFLLDNSMKDVHHSRLLKSCLIVPQKRREKQAHMCLSMRQAHKGMSFHTSQDSWIVLAPNVLPSKMGRWCFWFVCVLFCHQW